VLRRYWAWTTTANQSGFEAIGDARVDIAGRQTPRRKVGPKVSCSLASVAADLEYCDVEQARIAVTGTGRGSAEFLGPTIGFAPTWRPTGLGGMLPSVLTDEAGLDQNASDHS
jgi:hypothetical protein